MSRRRFTVTPKITCWNGFPSSSSYQAFSDRLNRLAPAFQALAEHWLSMIGVDLQEQLDYIVDSCPNYSCKRPLFRTRKSCLRIVREKKNYSSSRNEWYYGIKLHAVVARKPGQLPVLLSLLASEAAQHDLPAAKQIIEDHISLRPGRLYADKAYIDADWKESLKKNHALELLTPRKKRKDDLLISGDTFSTFVSSLRQPIECFFNWLNRLTNIQSASMARSLSGLLLYVFGLSPPLLRLSCSTLDSHLIVKW